MTEGKEGEGEEEEEEEEEKEEDEEEEDPCRFVYRKFLGEWNKLNYEVARFKGGVPLVFSRLSASEPEGSSAQRSYQWHYRQARFARPRRPPRFHHRITADNPFWSLFWR